MLLCCCCIHLISTSKKPTPPGRNRVRTTRVIHYVIKELTILRVTCKRNSVIRFGYWMFSFDNVNLPFGNKQSYTVLLPVQSIKSKKIHNTYSSMKIVDELYIMNVYGLIFRNSLILFSRDLLLERYGLTITYTNIHRKIQHEYLTVYMLRYFFKCIFIRHKFVLTLINNTLYQCT